MSKETLIIIFWTAVVAILTVAGSIGLVKLFYLGWVLGL